MKGDGKVPGKLPDQDQARYLQLLLSFLRHSLQNLSIGCVQGCAHALLFRDHTKECTHVQVRALVCVRMRTRVFRSAAW